jgi:hypothetical protein
MIEHLNDAALGAIPDDAPVTMLNLMRFRERSLDGNGSGWDAYLRYSQLSIKLIKARRWHHHLDRQRRGGGARRAGGPIAGTMWRWCATPRAQPSST